jgi:multidrug efflux pump
MAFTDPFIRRPVLASVISLLIVLLGIQAFNSLTIRQYPQMESALITVTTAYPGANAETIQGYITQPLQQSLASAEGVDYMTSVSQQNASVISVYARIGADTDRLYTELLSQANSVKNQLPQDAEDPVLNKQAADSTALMYISFYSDQLSNPQITDYLSRVIQPKLATLPGMAEAEILGNQVFAMRLWLDPVKLAAYGVSASDVNEAVRKYNFLSAAGEVKGQYVVTSINADTELKTPEAFAAIPLRTQGDSRVLLGDVARVEMGAESYNSISSFDGIPSVYIGIKGTPSANPLDVIKEVRAIMPQIEAQLPPGLKATIAYDATEFIQASIDEVVKTLAEAAVIVIVVVFLFLGSLRTVLIPRAVLHAGDGLLDQPADAAGHGVGDRPGGGRCHRRGGEHPPAYRTGQVTVPGGHRRRTGNRHAGGDHDHHPGGGLCPHRLPAGADRRAVPGVRPDPGRRGANFRSRGADAFTDDVFEAAAP